MSDCEPVSSVPCERDHKALKSKASCRQAFAFKLFSSVLYSDDEHLFFFFFLFVVLSKTSTMLMSRERKAIINFMVVAVSRSCCTTSNDIRGCPEEQTEMQAIRCMKIK